MKVEDAEKINEQIKSDPALVEYIKQTAWFAIQYVIALQGKEQRGLIRRE